MRKPCLYFLVGLWTLLVGGLAAWNVYGRIWISPEITPARWHETVENFGYLVIWVCGVTGTLFVHRRMKEREAQRTEAVAGVAMHEERWRSALQAVGDGVWDWNIETDIVFFSPTCLEMFGFAVGEISPRFTEWSSRVHPDDQAGVTAELGRHLAGQTETCHTEHRIRCKDGSYKWAHVRGRVVARAADGRPQRMIGTSRDLTKIREAEQRLRESEERYRHLLGSITDYVFSVELVDGQPGKVMRTPGCLAVTGYTNEELGADPLLWFETVAPTERAAVQAHWAAAMRGEPVKPIEYQIVHKNGSAHWVRGTLVPRLDAAGKLLAFDGLVQDITEAKQMETNLRESEARYRLIAENTGDVIWLFDLAANRFSYVSPSIVKLCGRSVDEALQLGLQAATTPEIFPEVTARLTARMAALAAGDESARTRAYELPLPHKDGSIVQTEVVTTLVTDASGRATHLQGVTRDITVRKQAEAELRRTSHWLEHTQRISRVGGWSFNLVTGEVWASAEARRIYGFGDGPITRSDIVGVPLAEYRPALDRALRDLVDRGVPYDLEFKIRRRTDGAILELHSVAERGRDGTTVIGVIQDITERKRADVALRESEARLAATLGAINDLIFVVDCDGRFVDCHCPPGVPLWMPASAFIGRRHGEFLPPAVSAQVAGALETLAATGEVQHFDYELVLNDAVTWWSASITRRNGADGVAIGAVLVCRDITDRKRAEREVREGRENYLGMFNSVSEAIYVHGPDGVFLDVNEGAAQMYGYARGELIGLTPAAVGAPGKNDLGLVGRAHAETFATGRPAKFEFWGRRKNGEAFPKACITHRGKYFGRDVLITTARDITVERRAEEALARSEHMLRESQRVAALGSYAMDIAAGRWESSAILDEIFGIDARFDRSTDGWASLIAPADRAWMVHYFTQEVVGQGKFFDRQYRIVRKGDGAERWVHGLGQLEFDAAHRPVRMFGTIQDITDRKVAESDLRKLLRAVEQSPVTVVITDLKGAIEYVNPSFTAKTGYSLDEVRGLTSRILRSGETSAEVYRELWQTITAGREWRGEFHNRKKNGELFWEAATISPIADETGRITHFLAVKEDVTERRQTLAALRQSEERFRLLVEGLPNIAVQGYDRERRVVFWNAASEALYGYTRAEALGRRLEDLIIPTGMRDGVIALVDRWIASGEAIPSGELVLQRKDGSPVSVFSSHVMLQQASGELEMHCIDIDLTERNAAIAKVREQAALLDVTQDAILVLSLDRVVTFWNRGAEKLYGIPQEQALGQRYESIAYRELPPDYDAEWNDFLRRGEWAVERRQIARERGEIVVQKRATLVRDEHGRAKSVLIVLTDITEAKRLEAQFLRAQRLESLGSLASGVAHDLNNVLTPILMSTGMLAETARTKPERDLIQLLTDSARRGADIVQQLLLFGRGSNSPRSPMNVATVIKDMVQMMNGTFPKGIAISVQLPKDLWMIDGDRTQIHQVMLNLCVNSRDAMPAGGKLSVVAENVRVDEAFAERHPGAKPGQHVVVRVTDTGDGISPANLEKIFDPFFTTKPTGQGTGLGLATVLGIVRSHGGFVIVESQEGVGSEFGVYLPARPSAVESVTAERDRPKLQGRGELVLVIDDEASIRSALARVLASHNYEVLVAGDGVEGVAVFVQNAKRIRLVITDIMMPVMDGTQAIRALRRFNPQLPVIAISGVPTQRAELESNFGPHIRFLPKPFLIDKALFLARELLDQPVVAPPAREGKPA